MCLSKTNNNIKDASAVWVIENSLLSEQLADYQQVLIMMSRPAARSQPPQAIRASILARLRLSTPSCCLIALRILLIRDIFFIGLYKKLLPRLFAMCAWLVAKSFTDLRMHHINLDLSHLSGYSLGDVYVNIEKG